MKNQIIIRRLFMIHTKTLIRYITDENHFDKLIQRLKDENQNLAGQWIVIDKNEAQSGTYKNINLYREEKKVVISMSGSPACIAAYAGNIRLLDYLMENGLLDDLPSLDPQEEVGSIFCPEICCTMVTETDNTYSEYCEWFNGLSPISFTLPEGKLDCFKLLMNAGQKCDFRNRANFRLLSLCRNRNFWEYLIDTNLLDRTLLLLAADYAFRYRNTETTDWLINHYNLFQGFTKRSMD